MPGPVSDSYDPEFGTGARAAEVLAALTKVRGVISEMIGSDELKDIVELAERYNDVNLNVRAPGLNEEELRIIRFALDRASESM